MKAKLVIPLVLMLLLTFPVNAIIVKVEEISQYKVFVNVSGENAHVKNVITLRNVISNPVVPGIGELRLQKATPSKLLIFPIPFTEKRSIVKVKNVKAYTLDGRSLDVDVVYADNYTIIRYQIWYPIDPMKELTFCIEYDADLVDKGILFKSLTIPIGADIDIKRLEIYPNSDWHLCYANPKMNNNHWIAKIPADHIAFFTAEFSILPLPMLPVRGYIAFWGTLIIIIVIVAVIARLKRQKNVPQ
jgi:hypothetical protein